MSEDTTAISRRRVLGGLATIGVASAAAGAGTMALFDDRENSTDNTVQAGTLDLVPAGSSDGSSFRIAVSGLVPGDEVQVGYLDLKNAGSVDGELDYAITGWTNYENGRNDAEQEAGDGTGGDPGAGNGELAGALEFRAFVDRSPGSGGRNEDVALTSSWVGLSTGRVPTGVPVDAGEEVRIWVDARLPSSVGDQVQSDSAEIDAAFFLEQA